MFTVIFKNPFDFEKWLEKVDRWKHTKRGKLNSYGIGNRVNYKKAEGLKSLIKIN